MRALEHDFAAAAAIDGDVYLPNFTPAGPVDAVLIGMEPSLGWWAATPAEAKQKVAAGFRNFMWSPEDFILHYAARRALCARGGTYHVTDISKGAMTVPAAHINRRARYARWAALLDRELQLVAKPRAHIVAIGREVRGFLERRGLGGKIASIMHYSGQAGAARNAAVAPHRVAFSEFSAAWSTQELLGVAAEVMTENSLPVAIIEETLARLRSATWSESRKKLAFIYLRAFEQLRAG